MLNTKFHRPARIALFAVMVAGGLLSNQSARAIVPDSTPADATPSQETSAPKQVPSKSQSVSPYAKMNRQRAQGDAARATTVPPTAATYATRKGVSGGARKN